MRVLIQQFLRERNILPAGHDQKEDSFGTERTQEKRRPDRTSVVPVQKRNKPL